MDAIENEEDDFDLSEAERRRLNFTFKLNSIELSVIEEKTDEDGSINHQSPSKGKVIGSTENLSNESQLNSDEIREDETVFRTDSEGNEALENLSDDATADEEPETVDNEDDSSERSLKGFEDVEQLLKRMPLFPKLRMLTRFRSFQYTRGSDDEDGSDEEQASSSFKKFDLSEFKSKMQSESNLDIHEDDDGEQEEEKEDDDDEDTIVPGRNFDMDAALNEVLEEASPEVQKAKWKMLKRILHKLPYRVNSFDLFGESDEDILENLFEQRKNKVSNSAGEDSYESRDSV